MTRAVSGRDPPCRRTGATWWTRLGEQIAGWNGAAAGAGVRQECPYNLTLGYDRIVAGQGLQQQDLQRLLAGRMVMVGGQFRASSDWVESPVHGQVPGVHYHAMALDNLIENGVDYRRNANAFLDSDLLKSLLIALLAFCGVLGVMLRNNLLDQASQDGMEPRLRAAIYGPLYLALFGVSIGLIGVATWFGVAYFNRSPINWIGLTTCALGFLFYATRQTLPADLCGSLERFALIRKTLKAHRLCSSALKFEEDRLLARRRARQAAQEGAESPAPGPADPQIPPLPRKKDAVHA
jgi:CHASE2 domain-containing sensor protein